MNWFEAIEGAYSEYGTPYSIGKSSKDVNRNGNIAAMRKLILLCAAAAKENDPEAMAMLEELLWEYSLLADPIKIDANYPSCNNDLSELDAALDSLLLTPEPAPPTKNDFVTAREAMGLAPRKPKLPVKVTAPPPQQQQHRLGMKRISSSTADVVVEKEKEKAVLDERLVGMDPKLIEMIKSEIMHRVDQIGWESIAGLEHAKTTLREIIIWPMLRP